MSVWKCTLIKVLKCHSQLFLLPSVQSCPWLPIPCGMPKSQMSLSLMTVSYRVKLAFSVRYFSFLLSLPQWIFSSLLFSFGGDNEVLWLLMRR